MIRVFRSNSVVPLPAHHDEHKAMRVKALTDLFLQSRDCQVLVAPRLQRQGPVNCNLLFSDRYIEVRLENGRNIRLSFRGDDVIEVDGTLYRGCSGAIDISRRVHALVGELMQEEPPFIDMDEENLA